MGRRRRGPSPAAGRPGRRGRHRAGAVRALRAVVGHPHGQPHGRLPVRDLERALSAAPANAQGKGKDKDKHYTVSTDRAVSVTRTVLVRQGFNVVRIERVGATQVVYYRAGNHGRGKGKGPLQKMVIRTVERRVVFEEVPPAVMIDIDVNLKL